VYGEEDEKEEEEEKEGARRGGEGTTPSGRAISLRISSLLCIWRTPFRLFLSPST